MDVCVNGKMDEWMGRHLLHGWMGQEADWLLGRRMNE